MAFFNYATKEITLKVVYYGPGLSGKTTNLQYLYSVLDPSSRGKFISLATEADRTLFFDFLPIDVGKIRDFSIRFQLYTVPGQIRYNATRKLVLKGADGVIFVADSQRAMKDENIESYANMKENLLSNNIDPENTPLILQYNKRDLPDLLTIAELNQDLNEKGCEYLEAEAVNGKGVEDTFRTITKTLLKDISKKHKVDIVPTVKEEPIMIKVKEKSDLDLGEEFPPAPVTAPAQVIEAPQEPAKMPEEVEAPPMAAIPVTEASEERREVPAERKETVEQIWPEERRETPKAVAPVSRPAIPAGAVLSDERFESLTQSLDGIALSIRTLSSSISSLSLQLEETKKKQAEMVDALIDMKIDLAKAARRKRRFFF
ncbi:MAG TPA: ADP-ribosylation factor-like protein [Thermodesulfovibrionales bacterium]|nr:ADP-ribosylation factor-like protein [Thermodesulfovibrionales bacterium]